MHSLLELEQPECSFPYPLRTLQDLPSSILAESRIAQLHDKNNHAFYIWKPVVLLLICLLVTFTIFGNTLICVAAAHNRHLRHSSNVFFIALAITNLLYACTVMIFSIVYNIVNVRLFTDSVCVAFQSLDMLFSTASILHLAAIAFDRFVHVHSSVTYSRKFTTKVHLLIISFLWMLSALLAFLPLQFKCNLFVHSNTIGNSSRFPIPPHTKHLCHHDVNLTCAVINATLSFFLPLIFMIVVYGRLFQITRQHLHQIKSQKPSVDLIVERDDNMSDKLQCEVGTSPEQSLNSHAVSSSSIRSKFFLEPADDVAELEPHSPAVRHHSDCSQVESRTIPRLSRSTNDTTLSFHPTNSWTNGTRVSRQRNSLSVPVRWPARVGSESVRSFGMFGRTNREPSMSMIMRMRITSHNEHKAAITLAVILGSFILCWMPYFSINCLAAVCHCIRKELYFAATWLGYLNACLNPVIYSLFNSQFRRACAKLLCAWRRCSKHEQYGLAKLRYCGDATIKLALGRVLWDKQQLPVAAKVPNIQAWPRS